MIQFVGTTFPRSFQWHTDEIDLISKIKDQITVKYKNSKNLFINTTWFGPQFDNGEYNKFIDLVNNQQFDNLFLLAAADPVFLNRDQISELAIQSGASQIFLIGHFDTDYYFNFHSTVLMKYFNNYEEDDIILKNPRYTFLNYNRKPRDHRTELVDKLISNGIDKYGIITLGSRITLGEKIEDYKESNWGMPDTYGIPHDIHSLGKIELWQNHFLINGQTKIYNYLRSQGFKTFTYYFPEIELENLKEFEVHDSIIKAIQYLTTLDKTNLLSMYNDMLPDLRHNRDRFFEFSKEQKIKIDNIFI